MKLQKKATTTMDTINPTIADLIAAHGKAFVTGVNAQRMVSQYLEQRGLMNRTLVISSSMSKAMTDWPMAEETLSYQSITRGMEYVLTTWYLKMFNAVVFDCATRCGAPKFIAIAETITQMAQKLGIPVIGVAMDSVRYSDGGKDVALMPTLWDGYVINGTNLAKESGTTAAYITTVFTKENGRTERLDGRLDLAANKQAIVKVLCNGMPAGWRKGIVFVNTIDDIKDAANVIKAFNATAHIWAAHCKDKNMAAAIQSFWNAKSGYLICAAALNNGIGNIPGVNTIIEFRKCQSPTVIKTIENYLSTGKNEVIFDFVGNRLNQVVTRSSTAAQNAANALKRMKAVTKRKKSAQAVSNGFKMSYTTALQQRRLNAAAKKWDIEDDEAQMGNIYKTGIGGAVKNSGVVSCDTLVAAYKLGIKYPVNTSAMTDAESMTLLYANNMTFNELVNDMSGRQIEEILLFAEQLGVALPVEQQNLAMFVGTMAQMAQKALAAQRSLGVPRTNRVGKKKV